MEGVPVKAPSREHLQDIEKDPLLVDKVDIVGLTSILQSGHWVLSVDEKSQIQALIARRPFYQCSLAELPCARKRL